MVGYHRFDAMKIMEFTAEGSERRLSIEEVAAGRFPYTQDEFGLNQANLLE